MGLSAKSLFGETPVRVSVDLLENLLAAYPRRDFQVRLWDGSIWVGGEQPRFTLVLKHPGALRAMFLSPSEFTLGEAYIYDDFDIEGEIVAAFDLADYLLRQERGLPERLHLAELLRKSPANNSRRPGPQPANLGSSVHSKERDRQAIGYHYDLPAEFYALWLDQSMIYSCAYFATRRRPGYCTAAQAGLHLQEAAAPPWRSSPRHWLRLGRIDHLCGRSPWGTGYGDYAQ